MNRTREVTIVAVLVCCVLGWGSVSSARAGAGFHPLTSGILEDVAAGQTSPPANVLSADPVPRSTKRCCIGITAGANLARMAAARFAATHATTHVIGSNPRVPAAGEDAARIAQAEFDQ